MSARDRGLRRPRTPFEVAVLAVAVVAVAAVVAGLLLSSGRGSGAPDLRVTVRPAGPRSGGETYVVRVRNEGGRTAESVVVEVTVGSETRETELVAVARRDEEHAVVVFPPGTAGEARARVLSFTEPAR